MKEKVQLVINNIKCNNKECAHNTGKISYDEFSSKHNYKCPKCESNVLTEKQIDKIKSIKSMLDILNNTFNSPSFDKEKLEAVIDITDDGEINFNY